MYFEYGENGNQGNCACFSVLGKQEDETIRRNPEGA